MKHVDVQDRCVWCQLYIEEATHVLLECNFARKVWEDVGMLSVIHVEPNDTMM